jgi:hypothetical protein
MVEVTFRSVVACQIKGGGDAAQRASGAGPALACHAGERVVQAQSEEREGGRRSWRPGAREGGRRPGGQPKEEERGGKGGKKKKEKRKRKGEKRKKEIGKKENKRRKIEKRFRKLGEISRKIRRGVKKDFCGFSWVFQIPALISGTTVMARRTGRRDCSGAGFPAWWPIAALGRSRDG